MHRISQESADLWKGKPGSCRVGFLDKDYSAKA